ncbi:MAG: hypothetical protein HY744_03120 [Deltaproteobacteria bacterium]|nr:hypothetical protein [Deltaproteobacteria bacterium]
MFDRMHSSRSPALLPAATIGVVLLGTAAPARGQDEPAAEAAPAAPAGAVEPSSASAEPAAAPSLGEPGESCQQRSDCLPELHCIFNVCRSEREGRSCAATADCGKGLRCRQRVCVQALCVPPVLPGCDAGAEVSGSPGGLEGTRSYIGLTAAPGFSFYAGGGDALQGSFLLALRAGAIFDQTELGLEFSPGTWVSGFDDETHLQLQATIGGYPRIGEQSYWPLRFGAGLVAVNTKLLGQLRADLIGFAYQLGPVLLEVMAPSYRFAFAPDPGIFVFSWQFGLSASYIGRGSAPAAERSELDEGRYQR